ncbi:MAG TPA: TIGR03086 family metal-binding protein [Acidimicrobiia bacterium]|nr:TIGR03086 family metal-binding protein [Acidimicrobiia bacterium]
MPAIPDADVHRGALTGFTTVVRQVPDDAWHVPTPCREWDAAALVEHVIGFHQYLLLSPLGVRAHRPREGTLARWLATEEAIRSVLDDPEALERPASFFDGATRRPVELLAALADDTLVHTWDLARAVGLPDRLEPRACGLAYARAQRVPPDQRGSTMYQPAVAVPEDADTQDHLLGLLGRDPQWRARTSGPRPSR